MQSEGIAWWLLVGMFGWGAAIGFLISLLVGKRLVKEKPGDWFEPCFRMFFALAGMVVLPLLAGLVAVALAFVAHHAGWDKLLPYLAGIGLVFLLLLASWILWTAYKPSSIRRQKG